MTRAPIKKFQLGSISVAAFQSEKGSISFAMPQKRFKNPQGEWDTAKGFFTSDLPVLRDLLNAAIAWAIKHGETSSDRGTPPQPVASVVAHSNEVSPYGDDDIPF